MTVGVDAQTYVALVHAGGWWNVTPALSDGTHTVAVSVPTPPATPGSTRSS